MQLEDLLTYLQTNNIQLIAAGQQIRVRAPKNTMTPQISQAIAQNRDQLLMHLHQLQLHESSRQNPLQKVTTTQKIPLSLNQQRLWLIHKLYQQQDPYSVPQAFAIFGSLDITILEKSLSHIILRHQILRTVFYEEDGVAYQKVLDPYAVELPCTFISQDISDEEKINKVTHEEAYTSFELDKNMLRFRLLQLNQNHHVLFLILHHCICDGSSLSILQKELIECYDAYTNSRPPQLADLPIQYSDFALWQRQWINDKTVTLLLDYWKNKLQGIQSLPFATDHVRPSQPTFRGNSITFTIEAQLLAKFKTLLRQQNCTLFMGLLAIYKILLSRYTNERDIVVGFPIACRNHPALQNLIGFVVNTVALRTKLDDKYSFNQTLQTVRQGSLETQAYQDMPFEKLVENLSVDRDPSRFAIFQNAFALQQNWLKKFEVSGITFQPLRLKRLRSRFDFQLLFEEVGDQLLGCWEYSVDLFEEATIKRMTTHFTQLLKSALASPDLPITQLQMLTENEKRQLLVEFNNTQADHPQHLVHELFAIQTQKTPDNIAIECQNHQLTYRELNAKAAQLARVLTNNHRQIIAIMAERSIDMVVGLLAILKAGAAYLPIDPDYPQQRIDYMLQDAKVDILLTTKNVKTISAKTVIYIDNPQIQQPSTTDTTNSCELFNIIYTSGSTGAPKGVKVKHTSVANLLCHFQHQLKITAQDTLLSVTTICFDISVLEIFLPLICGAKTIIATKDEVTNNSTLQQKLSSATIVQATPSLWRSLVQSGWKGHMHLKIVCGGEELSAALAHELLQRCNCLWNVYGPTETTIWSTSCHVKSANHFNIGKPIANTQVYVVQNDNHLCAIGIPGELCISGSGLAQGYLHRPQLTQEKFIDNPYQNGKKMYKTGDLVRWSPYGDIEFIGRIDHQVKIRGFRIEPGEVETTLQQHPQIDNVVVTAKQDENKHQFLVAYIATTQKNIDSQLRLWLQDKLPQYMIPSYFVTLDALPLTANKKVDRKALPQNFIHQNEDYIVPQNHTEEQLLQIWQQVLHITQISVNDNFFELGGHSLSAMVAVSRIQKKFSVDLPLHILFSKPTIREIATHLRKTQYNFQPIVAHNKSTYPLSSIQKQMWFLYQIQPQSSFYNIYVAKKLTGNLDTQILQAAIQHIVTRQSTLRTIIKPDHDGNAQQYIVNQDIALNIVSVNNSEQLQQQIKKITQTPFNLEEFPLVRFQLIQTTTNDYVFCIVIHHVISDYWSMQVIWREICAAYNALVNNTQPQLPALDVTYGDFCAWQQQQDMAHLREYWLEKYKDIPVLDLPTDKPRPQQQSFAGERFVTVLPKSLEQKLHSLAKEQGCTLFMVLTAAFNILLSRYSGQRDICVGFPIANRHYGPLEHNIGFFINNLVLRNDLRGNPTFNDFLQRVRKVTLEAYEHQGYPFEQLVEEINPHRDLTRNPIFQVLINMLEFEDQVAHSSLQDVTVAPFARETSTTRFDITLYIQQRDSLRFIWRYSTDLFIEQTIARMSTHFVQLLDSVATNPRTNIHYLPMLSESELSPPIIHRDLTYKAKNIIDLVEDSVTRFANKNAFIGHDNSCTYAQLQIWSDRLSAALQNAGVKRENRVVLVTDYSVYTLVAILGILKSGATCIPINPDFSTEKSQSLMEAATIVLYSKSIAPPTSSAMQIEQAFLYQERTAQKPKIHPEQTAFIIYTSGSTGSANGVAISHKNVASKMQTIAKSLRINAQDTCILTASLSFIAAIRQIFVPLIHGACLIVPSKETLRDPLLLFAQINHHNVTVVDFVPSYAKICAQTLLNNREWNSHSLRQIATSGEKLPAETVRLWRELIPNIRFVNIYGQTETTAGVTLYEVPQDISALHNIPIGRGVGVNHLYLLDSYLQPVPQGAIGEIYIASDEIARGYLNCQHTARKFIANPFASGIMYKTGDRARYNFHQQLEMIERSDAQIKIRGYRVDPQEIETTLCELPCIANAAVIFPQDVLQAYITSSQQVKYQEIYQYLQTKLPEYMLPQKIFTISHLPTTDSGKIDYRLLQDLAEQQRFLFTPKWVHKHLSHRHHDAQYLFFGEKPQGKSNALSVIPGTEFYIDHEHITMNFACENHYQQLVNYLRNIPFDCKNVIYAHHDVEHFAKFVQAFATYLPQMHIAIICRNVFALHKGSTVIPENALIVGTSRALALEYPGLRHTCIDIRCQPLTADILCEFAHNFPERNVLYDNGQRYVMHYEPVIPQETTVRDDDVYVITGGLGNIGAHLALFLAKKAKVKIAVTTRCIKNNAHKFSKLLEEVTKLGSELIVFETSLTNRDELSDTIVTIEKQLGKIRAVMHCAGSREQFSLLAQGAIITEETRFKIDSSTILIEALQQHTTAFLMLFSSLSSLLGRYAQASYCAANAYIDALAHSTDLHITSINWDVWKEQPLPLAANIPQDIVQLIHGDAHNGISNDQGTQAMLSLLNHPLRQAIVSTRSEITGYSIEELTTSLDFVAPTTSLQKQIAAIWCEVLHLESVSIHDNFFHVGGHSLLAITVMEKIRLLANIESSDHQSLPLSILLTHPTIAQLASAIHSLHSALQEQVIQMNSCVENRPFIFLVHGPGVDPICYQHLAKSLDEKFTVYAIRSNDLSHTTSLVDTAKYHIQKIKSVQKTGPYIVGGMCLGGLVAFEVAQQFSMMGEDVRLTFLMDLINIPGMENYKSQQLHKDKKRRQKKRLQKTILFWRHVLSGDVNFVVHKIKKIARGLSIKRKINKFTDSRSKLRKQMRAHMRTIRDEYHIQYYDGELIYIRSEKLQANYAEKRLRQLAKSVKVHKLSGTIHSDVTRPYFAEKTSEIIQNYLGISDGSSNSSGI